MNVAKMILKLSAKISKTSSEVRSVFTPLDPTLALIGKKPHFSLPDDERRISAETLPYEISKSCHDKWWLSCPILWFWSMETIADPSVEPSIETGLSFRGVNEIKPSTFKDGGVREPWIFPFWKNILNTIQKWMLKVVKGFPLPVRPWEGPYLRF